MNQTTADQQFAAGVGTALTFLTPAELKRFAAALSEIPVRPGLLTMGMAPIPALLQYAAEEGLVNVGWVEDFGGDWTWITDEPGTIGISFVVSFAATGWAAFELYHRIIGVDTGVEATPDNPAWENPDGTVNHEAIAAEFEQAYEEEL